MGGTAFVGRPGPRAAGPQPATSLEITAEGLWLVQALCAVETLPAVLVCRPFVSECGVPESHPGYAVLHEAGVLFDGDAVHPQVKLWMETLGNPDVVLSCLVHRGGEHLRVAIARRGEVTVAAARHGENVTVESLGPGMTLSGLVQRVLPLCGPVVAPASFNAVTVPTADLLSSLAQVLRGEHSPMVALGRLGMDADQHRIVTLAADHPVMELSMVVVTHGSNHQMQVSKTAATVTDTSAGRVVSGPVRSESGSWWTLIAPGSDAAILSALKSVMSTVGLADWSATRTPRR